jgi:uncharacterized protein YdiU (UPF0061 family)
MTNLIESDAFEASMERYNSRYNNATYQSFQTYLGMYMEEHRVSEVMNLLIDASCQICGLEHYKTSVSDLFETLEVLKDPDLVILARLHLLNFEC